MPGASRGRVQNSTLNQCQPRKHSFSKHTARLHQIWDDAFMRGAHNTAATNKQTMPGALRSQRKVTKPWPADKLVKCPGHSNIVTSKRVQRPLRGSKVDNGEGRRGLLEVCMVAGHVCHGGLCKELGNVPTIAHVVHHSLVTEQLQQERQ